MKENILKVFEQSTKAERRFGVESWDEYLRTAENLARYYRYPVESVVAAFCALSPNSDYIGNWRSTASCLRWVGKVRDEAIIVSSFKHCRDRALRFIRGEDFLSVTKGDKTRAFYQNILFPESECITVDGHLINIARGEVGTMRNAIYYREKVGYSVIEQAYREVADEVGLQGRVLQGTVWITWKRIHNIRYSNQMHLWGYKGIPAEFIKPYNPTPLTPVESIEFRRGLL